MQYELMKLRKGIPHFQIDCGYDEKHWENVDKENHIFYKTTFEIYRIHGNIEYWILKKSKKKKKNLKNLINSWDTRMMNGIIFDWKQRHMYKHWESSWGQLYHIYNYRGYIPSTGG